MSQSLDDAAFRDPSAGALVDHARQFILQRFQASDALPHLGEPRTSDRVRRRAGLLAGLWPAILADTGATVLVTANAMRLLGWRA